MWPFSRKLTPAQPATRGKSGESLFELQCKFGQTELEVGRGVVALVLDARAELGVPEAVKVESDGRQLAALRIASRDGGFVVLAFTPSEAGDPLHPGDAVMWVPAVYKEEFAIHGNDPRSGWVGLIRAKVAPVIDTEFHLTCRYD